MEAYESTINGLVTKDNISNYVMTDVTTDGTIIVWTRWKSFKFKPN